MFDKFEKKSAFFIFNASALVLAAAWFLDVGGARSLGAAGVLSLACVAVFSAALLHYGREKLKLRSVNATAAYCFVVVLAFFIAAVAGEKLLFMSKTTAFLAALLALVPPVALFVREELLHKEQG